MRDLDARYVSTIVYYYCAGRRSSERGVVNGGGLDGELTTTSMYIYLYLYPYNIPLQIILHPPKSTPAVPQYHPLFL
jgi:hypothetical protein